MDLRHLRYFVSVADEGSVTRAAEQLGIQQPPLSQQIRSLESELGIDLFKRLPRGVELTAAGRLFLRDARAILADVERATDRVAHYRQGFEGRVVIGMTASAAAHPFVPTVIRAYRKANPTIDIEHVETNAASLTDALARGAVDVAFVRAPVSHPAGMMFHRLLDEPMLAIVPADHHAISEFERRPSIRLKALRDEGFILVRRPGAPGMYADLLTACARLGFAPRIVAEVDRMLTNISLVAAGFGVSAVPASMSGFHSHNVAYCTMRDAPQLKAPMTLVYRRGETNLPVDHLIQMTRKLASEPRLKGG